MDEQRYREHQADDMLDYPDDKPRALWPLVYRSCLVLALFIFGIALLQSCEARAHDIYTEWKTKDGISCCNNLDCRPAEARQTATGFEVIIDNEWVKVPPERVRDYKAPDLGAHVCHSGKHIFCFVFTPGM